MKSAVAHARRDVLQHCLRVENLIHVRAPPHQCPGQHPVANALTHALHDIVPALPLVERGSPLDVEHNLQAMRGLRFNVTADDAERSRARRFRGPRAEHPRASLGARHDQRVLSLLVRVRNHVLPLGEAVSQVFPGPSRERALDIDRFLLAPLTHAVRVFLPVLEPPSKVLAVPEAKRVQGHDVVPRSPPC